MVITIFLPIKIVIGKFLVANTSVFPILGLLTLLLRKTLQVGVFRHQDLRECHFLCIYCKDTTGYDFLGTGLYCKEVPLPGSLKILFV